MIYLEVFHLSESSKALCLTDDGSNTCHQYTCSSSLVLRGLDVMQHEFYIVDLNLSELKLLQDHCGEPTIYDIR